MTRDEIADRDIALLPALLGRPFAERQRGVPLGEAIAHDIRREARDRDAAGVGDDEGNLRLGGQRRDRGRLGRTDDAEEELNMLARDELLRDALADFGL